MSLELNLKRNRDGVAETAVFRGEILGTTSLSQEGVAKARTYLRYGTKES